eukprot:TRINITY_DN819_c0_g1_i1.p1 TRINITY_DN819_c0_g1~~TRINITY_DN819_c0_g1_i1.p1  ORF type:complete len:398 (-),score=11.10 TRINITY_DN819_c0_g1_i1:94-1287(-)
MYNLQAMETYFKTKKAFSFKMISPTIIFHSGPSKILTILTSKPLIDCILLLYLALNVTEILGLITGWYELQHAFLRLALHVAGVVSGHASASIIDKATFHFIFTTLEYKILVELWQQGLFCPYVAVVVLKWPLALFFAAISRGLPQAFLNGPALALSTSNKLVTKSKDCSIKVTSYTKTLHFVHLVGSLKKTFVVKVVGSVEWVHQNENYLLISQKNRVTSLNLLTLEGKQAVYSGPILEFGGVCDPGECKGYLYFINKSVVYGLNVSSLVITPIASCEQHLRGSKVIDMFMWQERYLFLVDQQQNKAHYITFIDTLDTEKGYQLVPYEFEGTNCYCEYYSSTNLLIFIGSKAYKVGIRDGTVKLTPVQGLKGFRKPPAYVPLNEFFSFFEQISTNQ